MQTPGDVIAVGEGFWNLRGAFRLGPFDIGTQASLVALEEGGHVILDACDLSEEGWRWLDEATEGLAPLIRKEIWDVIRLIKASGIATLVVDKNVNVLLDLTDRQVMELGMQLDVPWALAWSCDLEGPAPCRVCAGCRRRQEHFAAVRLRDPAAETLRRPA